ncbi:MAG TPA: VOC family protein [Caulobacteraceae bacterium]|jgi:catechol 2,3-dioxygenase
MNIPETNLNPPFRFRRASHAVFTTTDLHKSREFYTEVIGLVVSDEDADTLYLRGLEERAHHSLVIKRADEPSACLRVGMRVFDDEELDRARHYFDSLGAPCEWVEVPFQGRTLQTVDAVGTPLEIVATMAHQPRRDMDVQIHRGAAARRFDHYQVTTPDVAKAAEFYTAIGFRIADYMIVGDRPVGVFLHAKDTPYDIVFVDRDALAFHHYAYIIPDIQAMLRACDTAGALGWGDCVEFGPGKHSLGHSYYVYLLDPDGHRVELLLPPIVCMDGDDKPAVWDLTDARHVTEAWGLPPRKGWFSKRSRFPGVPLPTPSEADPPQSLEAYLRIIP